MLQLPEKNNREFSGDLRGCALPSLLVYVIQCCRHISVYVCIWQLLDVFGHRSNVSLVFDYMDTDLEVNLHFLFCSFAVR